MEAIKKYLHEWLLTFSNEKSLLSSKRLERFAVFTTMLGLTIFFTIKAVITCTIGAAEFMIVVGGWLGYAGFNTVQIKKDVKGDNPPT